MLEIVFFGFDVATDGVDDTAVRREAEGGDFFVEVLERLVQILSVSRRNKKATEQKEQHNTEMRKPGKLAEEANTHHGCGRACDGG